VQTYLECADFFKNQLNFDKKVWRLESIKTS